nr:hypothetical protein [Tanacetum cinerariifolium]
MSRDVITVGLTMRILLLSRGEYSQWREWFMNYFEKQTDGEAMIYSIQNGDHPLPVVAQVSLSGTTQNAIPTLKDPNNETAKDLWDALERQMCGSEYGEQDRKAVILYEYETFKATEGEHLFDTYLHYLQVINDLKKCGYKKDNCDVNDALGYKKKAVMVTSDPLALVVEKMKITVLLAKAFNRKKYYAKPTNNNLRTSSASSSTNKKPEYVKSVEKKEDKKADEKKRDMRKTKMLLAKKDSDEQVLFAEDQAWMESSSDSDQETNANMVFMAKMEKVLSDSDESSSSAEETIAENVDLLAQTEVLQDQLKVKYFVIDTHIECQAQYAKLKEERYEYMIRYSALCANDKQHRKKIDEQEILFDKISRQLVEMNNNVLRLQEKILEKVTKISELEGCIINPDFEKIDSPFQQTSSLKPYVSTVILEKIIIDLEDEVVSLLEKEKANLKTIESLKSKGFESSENAIFESENQSENDCLVVEKECGHVENSKVIAPGMFKLNLDTFSSVRRPKHSGVIWKQKRSFNTSNVDLSSVSHLKLNEDVKRYSRKDLLCDLFDENNLFIFDYESVRISPVSKMPFRKKPHDSMNESSKSNLNKSLPRTMHRWLPKMQPLAEPIAKWIPRICLWIIDSGCSKHMTGNRALLTNFLKKFLGTVRFGNNNFPMIVGYGDVVIGSMTIKKVYYVEGLGHNLFSVGQFCDKGLEVAFRKSTCFVRNEDAKASSSQSWLWHQRLSHLNFATINNLVKNNLVQGLPKMKFKKDHLCSACEQGKIHRKHHKSKTAFALNKPLYLLYMDLCSPMRVESLNGKRYVLVVVDDYSWYTWVFFLHSKDEASEVKISFIKKTQVNLQLQAEAIATTCFTQNRSIIHKRFDKTPYELMNKRKPNIKFFRVFECRCYLLNDYWSVGKLKEKGDIGVFVGYSKESVGFRIYNKRTRKIHESVNVNFDEISEMASKQLSLEPGLSNLNEMRKSSNPSVSQVSETSKKDLEDLFQKFYDEYFDSLKIMKSSTTNVETSSVKIPSHEEENFHLSPSCTPTRVEVPKKLLKVSMVNTILKKLKHHLAGFDVVVKETTTTTTITEGSWGLEHIKACFRDEIIPFVKARKDIFNTFDQYLIDKLTEVQNVFHQMEQVNGLKAQSQEKDTEKGLIIAALKDELRKLKGKSLVDNVVTTYNITLEMLKIDVEPIAPRSLNNKTAHSDYLRLTQEHAVILREVVEQRKSQNPLNNSLDSACKYTKRIHELLIIIRQTCPGNNNSNDKLVAVTTKNKDKRFRFTEPITSSGYTNTQTDSSSNLVSNKSALSFTGVHPSTSASGSQPSGNTKKDKIPRLPRSTQKNKVEAHPRTVKSSLKNKN